MNTSAFLIKVVAGCGLLCVAQPGRSQITYFIPERFGVIDITPTNLTAEHAQNSEPSMAVGVNTKYGKSIVHAFTQEPTSIGLNNYYTSQNHMGPEWMSPGTSPARDATVDWSAAGNCYLALIPTITQIKVLKSTDPATIPFSEIAAATITRGTFPNIPDQPWIRVVTVTNTDHIFVGFNDGSAVRKPGTVRYSLDNGTTWSETVLDRVATRLWDGPPVRLAISGDGRTVYGLFQRITAGYIADTWGDVVLMRDDAYGGGGFSALGAGGEGTKVGDHVLLPGTSGTSLGAQRLGSGCDVAIDPARPATVYVAYTELYSGVILKIRVCRSDDSGAHFSLVYTINDASLPALVGSPGTELEFAL